MELEPLTIISVNALVATQDSGFSFIYIDEIFYIFKRKDRKRAIISIQTKDTQSVNNVSLFNVSLFISKEKAFREESHSNK